MVKNGLGASGIWQSTAFSCEVREEEEKGKSETVRIVKERDGKNREGEEQSLSAAELARSSKVRK